MTRFVLFILIILAFFTGSCSSRKNKLASGKIIPEKELISILTDLYISGGLLSNPEVQYRFSSLDTISSSVQIIEQHGYTKDLFDKTMKYYFVKKPKELIRINDQVLSILSEMESRYEKEYIQEQARLSNLWPGYGFYSFPDPSGRDSTWFNIDLNQQGKYTLAFTVTLFPDDQSVNPGVTLYLCNPDSILTGTRHYFNTLNYIKDGQPHSYSLIVRATGQSNLHVRGRLYDFDNHPDDSEKHIIIDNISFTFISAAI